jgi:hypothetical protein
MVQIYMVPAHEVTIPYVSCTNLFLVHHLISKWILRSTNWQRTLLSVITLTNARQIYTVYRQTILLVSGRVLSVNSLTNTSANVFY